MTQDPNDEQKAKKKLAKRKKIVIGALTALLLVTFLIGTFVRFFPSAVPPEGLHKILIEALDRTPEGDLTFEFAETRQIPGGAALQDWLEPVANHEKILSAKVDYQALYALDGKSDWELSMKPDGNGVVMMAPLPEFKGAKISPDSFYLQIAPGATITPEDRKLAEEIIFEKMQTLAREDETITRRKERLESCRERVREWINVHLKTHQLPTSATEVFFAGEAALTEEPQ